MSLSKYFVGSKSVRLIGRAPGSEVRPSESFWSINILVIEDEAADTNLILNALRRHPDVASVQAVDDPGEGLRLLECGQLRPDLILLDIKMPKIDGLTFLPVLREIPGMADIPVVILTTSRLARDVKAAQESSACLYVVKPDTFPDLQVRLDIVVKRAISGAWS